MGSVTGRIVGLIVVIGVVAAIVVAVRPDPVPVDTVRVVRGPMEVTVDEEGRTRVRERYVVSSPLRGRLGRITLDPGDPVTAGRTIVARIDPADPALLDARTRAEAAARVRATRAMVSRAGATLEQARAEYDYAENEVARARAARAEGAASDREVDERVTRLRTAEEVWRAARFSEEIARFELEQAEAAFAFADPARAADEGAGGPAGPDASPDRAPVRLEIASPVTGEVLRVFIESMTVVEPGTALLEVGDRRDLDLVVDVLSTDAVRVSPGDRVRIEDWGGDRPLAGVVRVVEPAAFTEVSALGIEEQRVNVVVDLLSPPADRPTLGDGFRVDARIITWAGDDVLQIPTSAVFRDPDAADERWLVFRLAGDRVELRPVRLGRRTWRTTEVLDGLAPGDRVVIHPGDRLAAGVRVAVRDAPATG